MSAISLPSNSRQNATLSSSPTVAKGSTGGGSTPAEPVPRTILVVDDDHALRTTTVMMLECQGFKTVSASNGLEALQQMERNPQISAVLLDLLMPVMDGEETFRQLRNFWTAVPVIVISGFDLSEMRQNFVNPPPDGFVQKPFNFAKLSAALGSVLA